MMTAVTRLISIVFPIWAACAVMGGEIVLFDAAQTPASAVRAQDGASFVLKDGLLRVTTKPGAYPGVAIRGNWDLSSFGKIEVELVDGGIYGAYTLRLLNPGGNAGEQRDCYVARLPVKNEKHILCSRPLPPALPNWSKILPRLTVVRTWALPYLIWGNTEDDVAVWNAGKNGVVVSALDPAKPVTEVAIYINKPMLPHTWSLKRIVVSGKASPADNVPNFAKMTPETFFPFIDKYGQFMHREWPDKIHSDADFARQRQCEEVDLAAHPGPSGWDTWGGWADGPQLTATGSFRVEKVDGKWWMVDPDGRLWWSHGPVRVTPSGAITPLDKHEDWFADLPPESGSPFSLFYTTRDELLYPYYVKRGIKRTYDFSAANVRRKYGEDWFSVYAELAHRRLRSWGCNTIANSSDLRICRQHKTPYTDRFELKSRPIAGSHDGWWPFRDPFDPSFRAEVRRQMALHKTEMDDVWCFGFFVDNELSWGEPHSLGLWSLQSPADQPAKKEFIRRLKKQYGEIIRLNAAWKTSYADWTALEADTKGPDPLHAKADLEAFSSVVADAYYANIRAEFKKAAPNKLYLGCRYAGGAKAFNLRAAAKYCDVISFNIYRKTLSAFKLPEGIDKPVMIGEFHFGALDRGPFCPGLILLKDQNERARIYEQYVRSALEHPNIVGVHWHQFSDQATSGRFDGENMQVGWTDCCDTPYRETIGAVRKIGYDLYRVRAGKK